MPDLFHSRSHPSLPRSPSHLHSQRFKVEQADDQLAMAAVDELAPSNSDERESQKPAKRARKAINCEPCRASKLKCDRARPCSSCVLRGTVTSCYQGSSHEQADDSKSSKADPHSEIAHIRQSLASLEAYLVRSGSQKPDHPTVSTSASTISNLRQDPPPIPAPPPRAAEGDALSHKSAPGMLAQEGQGGLYAGPTSMVTHLLSFKSDRESTDSEKRSATAAEPQTASDQIRPYDNDLLEMLPQLHIIDGLIDFYFEYCNWMYRHVHPQSFQVAWNKYKNGQSSDRLTLATACVIMALAIRYIPSRHALLASLPNQTDELCSRYYAIARDALGRYRLDTRVLSLELVEHLLIRTHYLTLSKNEAEEIWGIRGELVSIGTAMGLHRDPDKWKMPRDLAERRRWAWWHIILLERWQCFLFGRPLSVASHHFDTRMPSHIDPEIDPNGRLFLPNLHLFRLAFVLGHIVDDAVSIRPVAYERIQARDQELVEWLEDLPTELDLDEYRLARQLASPLPTATRLAVQSIIVRTSFYHIRFSLHRPYAAAAHDAQRSSKRKQNNIMSEHMAQSLDTAVHAADKLIQLVGQCRPDLLANSSLAVPGHVHWGPFHCFSAAMFFAFQLIASPDQPGANLFRSNIRRVQEILNMSRGVAIADKAINMLTVLAPLFEAPVAGESTETRETKKKQVLSVVKGLAFPYHDSPAYPNTHFDSPARRGSVNSPLHSSSVSPPSATTLIPPMPPGSAPPPGSQLHLPHMHPSNTNPGAPKEVAQSSPTHGPPYAQASPHVQQSVHGSGGTPHNSPAGAYPPTHALVEPHFGGGEGHANGETYVPQLSQPRPPPHQPYPVHVPEYSETAYVQGANDSMWGASVGFGHGEWVRFLDVMNRSDSSHMT